MLPQFSDLIMPIPTPTLRHLFPSTTSNPNIVFTPDDSVLHSINGRIQLTDPNKARTRTLPFEATRNLISISLSKDRLLTVDEKSRAALFFSPFLRPFARLSLRFRVLTGAISPCGTMAAFMGDRMEVWQTPAHAVPSFAAWDKLAEFGSGLTSTACLTWTRDSRRIAVGLSSGNVVLYTLQTRVAGVHVKPLILHGHRTPITAIHCVGERGLITLSEDGALFCWRLRFNDESGSLSAQEYSYAKENPLRNPKRRLFIVPVDAKLISRHFVKQGGAKRVRSCDVADPLIVVGLSNGSFALYELPDHMTREDKVVDEGLFELGNASTQRRTKRLGQEHGASAERESNPVNFNDDKGSGPVSSTKPNGNKSDEMDVDSKQNGNADERNEMDVDTEDQTELNDDSSSDEPKTSIGFTDLTLLQTLSASGGEISRIAFSKTGAWIAMTSAYSGQLIVWDWRAETHILKQQGHALAAEAVAFSPDGRAIATGSKDGRVKLWSLHSGFCVATFTNHEAAVSAVTFSANDVIISASYDGTVRAFDVRRYRNFRVMVGPPPQRQFGCVAADGAGDLVAAGCIDTFEIIVWSLRTGQVLELLNGHTGPVSAISFRPLRGTLASSSWDRSVRLWDMYERKGTCEKLEHSKEVLSVCYRPDGREFAACTSAGEIVIWDAESTKILGTVDGARDAAPGRTRESRTVAPEKGYFQSICYSADGRFIIGGAASQHMCFYHVSEGYRPVLLRKIITTQNQQFDGLLAKLNSKHLTDSGHAVQEVDDDDELTATYGMGRLATRKSVPGARSEAELQRRQLVKAEVRCVRACATGRLWAAVTAEGVLVYGDVANDEYADALFDPTHLDVDVTPKSAQDAVVAEDFNKALLIALRLNERDCLNYVIEKIPVDRIHLIASQISPAYFSRIISLFAWRLDNTRHLEFNLRWAKSLLLEHGQVARENAADVPSINSSLRALSRACAAHSKRITPIADQNESTLRYLSTIAKRKKEAACVE